MGDAEHTMQNASDYLKNSALLEVFSELDTALLESGKVGKHAINVPLRHSSSRYVTTHTLSVYDFGDVKIAKEQRGSHPSAYIFNENYKFFDIRPSFYGKYSKGKGFVAYYVLHKDKVVEDGEEARELIKQVTGVELPAFESDHQLVSVVTSDFLERHFFPPYGTDEQPDDKCLAEQAKLMRRQLEKVPEDFTLANVGYDPERDKEVIEIMYELSEM